MLELGPDAGRYHAEIGVLARDSGVDLLITVGPLASRMGAGFGGAVLVTETAAQAAGVVADALEPGDTVLDVADTYRVVTCSPFKPGAEAIMYILQGQY